MNKKEKLAVIESKIRELVPRTMEFSFGCEFIINDDCQPIKELRGEICIATSYSCEWEIMTYELKNYKLNREQYFATSKESPTKRQEISTEGQKIHRLFNEYNYCEYESRVEDFIKIIGHPITLDEVLESWQKSCVYKNGHPTQAYMHFFNLWKYGTPLSDQSEDLISFLYDIFNG